MGFATHREVHFPSLIFKSRPSPILPPRLLPQSQSSPKPPVFLSLPTLPAQCVCQCRELQLAHPSKAPKASRTPVSPSSSGPMCLFMPRASARPIHQKPPQNLPFSCLSHHPPAQCVCPWGELQLAHPSKAPKASRTPVFTSAR